MFGKLCDRSCSAKQPSGDKITTPTWADKMMSCQINHADRKKRHREESLREYVTGNGQHCTNVGILRKYYVDVQWHVYQTDLLSSKS